MICNQQGGIYVEKLSLKVLPKRLAVCSVDKDRPIPKWVLESRDFYSITRTRNELSIVSAEESVPIGVKAEKGWAAIEVEGPLGFDLIGIVSSLTTVLAENEISVFVLSTYNTDYILIKEENLKTAKTVLSKFYLVS
ncbi:ACT domain-containing protein [Halocella sp. SP3-1]|nr:ACT domain-containing protein [Halocella sp. SP3-1]